MRILLYVLEGIYRFNGKKLKNLSFTLEGCSRVNDKIMRILLCVLEGIYRFNGKKLKNLSFTLEGCSRVNDNEKINLHTILPLQANCGILAPTIDTTE